MKILQAANHRRVLPYKADERGSEDICSDIIMYLLVERSIHKVF